jgi:lactoylglutathione lyase
VAALGLFEQASVAMLEIKGTSHVGARVSDRARAVAFYEKLGFVLRYTDPHEPVLVLRNADGVEVNLIVNAAAADRPSNVLMDVKEKYTGWTHVAWRVASIERTVQALRDAGIEITEGPKRLDKGVSCFIRDPDRNVIELRQED